MGSELQDTLARLMGKTEVLVEKYNALKAEKEAVDKEVAELRNGIVAMAKRLEKLQQDYDYLKLARTISTNREELNRNRDMLGKLVQDIDKCISQLME